MKQSKAGHSFTARSQCTFRLWQTFFFPLFQSCPQSKNNTPPQKQDEICCTAARCHGAASSTHQCCTRLSLQKIFWLPLQWWPPWLLPIPWRPSWLLPLPRRPPGPSRIRIPPWIPPFPQRLPSATLPSRQRSLRPPWQLQTTQLPIPEETRRSLSTTPQWRTLLNDLALRNELKLPNERTNKLKLPNKLNLAPES